jgi:hypothetical protein
MRITARAWSAGLALLLCLGSTARGETPGFRWPVPQGWPKETIPFPLGFAPEVPYKGTEEIRFSPGMFDPKAPGYWTYTFVWWLEGEPDVSAGALSGHMSRYFSGLCRAVGGTKYQFAPARFKVELAPAKGQVVADGHGVTRLQGTADLYEAFATGKELRLNLEVHTWDCPQSHRRVVRILASPQPLTGEGTKALRDCAAAFHCHGG